MMGLRVHCLEQGGHKGIFFECEWFSTDSIDDHFLYRFDVHSRIDVQPQMLDQLVLVQLRQLPV